jgi:hypothetical protein
MIESESRVLRQYIARHLADYDEWRFNVRIGEGVDASEIVSPDAARAFAELTKARPDTVAFKFPDLATIVEVKDAFTNEAVWQILSYRDLYKAAFPEHRIALVGLGAHATPGALNLARMNGIRVFVYAMPAGAPDVNERAAEESGSDS